MKKKKHSQIKKKTKRQHKKRKIKKIKKKKRSNKKNQKIKTLVKTKMTDQHIRKCFSTKMEALTHQVGWDSSWQQQQPTT